MHCITAFALQNGQLFQGGGGGDSPPHPPNLRPCLAVMIWDFTSSLPHSQSALSRVVFLSRVGFSVSHSVFCIVFVSNSYCILFSV